jgi:hypothetical protein
MQTTLRIDDRLYREAKAEAARSGLSLTRFLEEGLRLRLENQRTVSMTPHTFRTYTAGKHDTRSLEEIRRLADEEQNEHETAQLVPDLTNGALAYPSKTLMFSP